MNKQVRDFSRAMKIIRNKPVKMLETKSTAQRIPYMDFSVDLTKESVNIKLKVNRNCPNWNKKRKRSGASKQSIQNLLENIKQSNKSITNLRRERKRTGKHKYFNKTMVENFSKITKTSNLDPISSENSKQDKYQEKKMIQTLRKTGCPAKGRTSGQKTPTWQPTWGQVSPFSQCCGITQAPSTTDTAPRTKNNIGRAGD